MHFSHHLGNKFFAEGDKIKILFWIPSKHAVVKVILI